MTPGGQGILTLKQGQSCDRQLLPRLHTINAMRKPLVTDGLPACDKPRFIDHVLCAGDIDIVMGGPPCQGVTGLNRHAVRNDIRDDSR